jgi:hypothetical protein
VSLEEVFAKYPDLKIRTNSKLLENKTHDLYIENGDTMLELKTGSTGQLQVQEVKEIPKQELTPIRNLLERQGD